MDLSNNASFIFIIILLGNSAATFIFLIYYFSYDVKTSKLGYYIISKISQIIGWLFFLLRFNELTGLASIIPDSFLLIGCGMEVYCMIQLNRTSNLRLKSSLSILTLFALLTLLWFNNSPIANFVEVSFSIAIFYIILFVHLALKQKKSKMQIAIGWTALVFAIFNITRIATVYILKIPFFVNADNVQFIPLISALLWIVVAFSFPLLYLFVMKEKDITELEEIKANLESKVRLRTKELETSLKHEKELAVLKTNFISMASHEFRTPLAAINATTDVLQKYGDRLKKEDVDKRYAKIKKEVNAITAMLEDILAVGKSDAHQLKFEPTQLKLVEKLNEIISDFQLGQDSPKPILFYKPESEIILNADLKLLKNIVTNLLSNAIKYSDSNVEINLKKENDTVVLSVKDYGIGIPKKDLEHLFEPFHRGENVENASGTGLGLAVVQNAVELHGGTIEVESEVGVGTTFRITFPL